MTTLTTMVRLGTGSITDDEPRAHALPSRTVGELRPKAGVIVTPAMSVADAAVMLAAERQDACLVLSTADGAAKEASLEGILTDADVTRKVLSLGLEPESVRVRDVMTREPVCICDQSGVDVALSKMLRKRCRHLPVVDADGFVSGLLDISKLMFDVMQAAQNLHGAQRMLSDLFEDEAIMRMGGDAGSSAAPTQRVMQAALLMAERRSALLVSGASGRKGVDGILTPKDLLHRAVAAGRPTATVTVSEVMTKAPDVMPGSATVLQALHQLSTGGYRSVPVVDAAGEPLEVLDVLALVQAAIHTPEPIPKAGIVDGNKSSSIGKPSPLAAGAAKVIALGRVNGPLVAILALGSCVVAVAAKRLPLSAIALEPLREPLGKAKGAAMTAVASMQVMIGSALACTREALTNAAAAVVDGVHGRLLHARPAES